MQIWADYGIKAEYLVANYLLNKGFNVNVSKNSRGVDILAWNERVRFCIQVKASLKSVHLKGREITQLKHAALTNNCKALVAIVRVENNRVELYSLDGWEKLDLDKILC